jgi:hypothetical protein
MYLKWENRWGMGDGGGEEKGGEVSTQVTWDQSGRELHHNAKEGFQASKRGSGTGEGFSRQRGIFKGIVHAPPIQHQPCTYRANCVCVCSANKELCLDNK